MNSDLPHTHPAAIADIDDGKMDGFLAQAEALEKSRCLDPKKFTAPRGGNQAGPLHDPRELPVCGTIKPTDALGYHDFREIPHYWAYASNFVLQDHMFENAASWSWPQHLYMTSERSATCPEDNPLQCVNAVSGPPSKPKLHLA